MATVPASKPWAPFVPWRRFIAYEFPWAQGEHVSLIGPTGAGKTTLASRIAALRAYVVAFAVKPMDETMDVLVGSGYLVEQEWIPQLSDHIVLWPPMSGTDEDFARQKRVFVNCLNSVYAAGGWCALVDEVSYFVDELKMSQKLRLLWHVARAGGASVLAATQRPAYVPLAMYDMATHLFFWRDNDNRNLARIGEMGGPDTTRLRRAVATLDMHEVLYYNTRTGVAIRTEAPTLRKGG